MTRSPSRRLAGATGGSVLVTAVFAVVLWVHLGGVRASDGYVDDLGELAAAAVAAVACFARSRDCDPGRRRAWCWLGVSAACWAAGEAVWSWYDLVLGVTVPFPSVADVGFLASCPTAIVGVLSFVRHRSGPSGRVRLLLDGFVTAGSLLFISWVTVIGPTVRAEDGGVAQVVALAYPLADIATVTMVLLVMMRCGHGTRRTLVLIAVALGSLALADSTFSYLEATGSYGAGSPADAAWVGAYLLLATAAFADRSDPSEVADETPGDLQALLPYLVIFPALLVAFAVTAAGRPLGRMVQAEGLVVLLVVTARQLVVIRQNGCLTAALQATIGELNARQDELRHLATHDSLTGLVNRSAVVERAAEAMARYERARRPMALLVCDVDHFKQVNDVEGHQAGDRVLRDVARSLVEVSRAGDVVGRVGGDEFIIVAENLPDADAAETLATRVVDVVAGVTRQGGPPVSISVGMATLDGSAGGPVAYDEVFQRADLALYRAKAEGRACWRHDRGGRPVGVSAGRHPDRKAQRPDMR